MKFRLDGFAPAGDAVLDVAEVVALFEGAPEVDGLVMQEVLKVGRGS